MRSIANFLNFKECSINGKCDNCVPIEVCAVTVILVIFLGNFTCLVT